MDTLLRRDSPFDEEKDKISNFRIISRSNDLSDFIKMDSVNSKPHAFNVIVEPLKKHKVKNLIATSNPDIYNEEDIFNGNKEIYEKDLLKILILPLALPIKESKYITHSLEFRAGQNRRYVLFIHRPTFYDRQKTRLKEVKL